MPKKLCIAVAGAGQIGQRHIALIQASTECQLAAIVDPGDGAGPLARELGVERYLTLDDLLARVSPDGLILATPNHLHVEQALAAIAAGVPTLVEKPVAHTYAAGLTLQAAAEKAGAKMLVGHHRQHGSVMAKAVEIVQSGVLGRLVSIVGTSLIYKADNEGYYDGPNSWRREAGGGPVLINMIHEIGNMRALAGDIVEVQALVSNATRGFAVEDTAAITLRFASGALGTFAISDTAASDRNWEHTSGEDKIGFGRAHSDDDDCYIIAGTMGSLAVPTLRLKRYLTEPDRSWRKPLERSTLPREAIDPLAAQIAHFCAVIRGEVTPRVTVRDGIQNLRIVDAILQSAKTGKSVRIED